MKKYAAFDIGSNAIRLAIGEFNQKGQLKVSKKIRVPLRLGTEAFNNGHFSDYTVELAARTFSELKKILIHEEVDEFRAVATSAYRNALNSDYLSQAILDSSGISIELIDGQLEAGLIRQAICEKFDLSQKDYLLFDIGGGSTELTFMKKGQTIGSTSLPVGTVRLLEIGKKARKEGLSPKKAYLEYLFDLNDRIIQFSKEIGVKRPVRVIGTGGNFKRLTRLRKKVLGKKDISFINPDEVAAIREAVEETPFLNRMKKFNLRPDRADVIVPAIYIIEKVIGIIPIKKIYTPDVGLVNGVLLSFRV